MSRTQDLGKKGEDFAIAFLKEKGYELQTRNYRYKKGEIDSIWKIDNKLIFVEVKLRSNDDFGLPEEMVGTSQQSLILQTAENYILETNWEGNIRFDIIAILNTKKTQIEHFEDAFY